ncbi:MAG: TIGR00725 family protein [Actinomycetia bacterium]|nr:TIGR00725 family protein [Actinomycetes bacterium]
MRRHLVSNQSIESSGLYIGLIGPGEASTEELDRAETAGRLLAERGAISVCGGLGGVMEAAARGASSATGLVIGILPGRDRAEANPHVTVAIPTGLGEMRNPLVVGAADALIAIGGAYRTLSEVALARRTNVPVVGLGTWDLPDVLEGPGPAEAVELALALARTSGAED